MHLIHVTKQVIRACGHTDLKEKFQVQIHKLRKRVLNIQWNGWKSKILRQSRGH